MPSMAIAAQELKENQLLFVCQEYARIRREMQMNDDHINYLSNIQLRDTELFNHKMAIIGYFQECNIALDKSWRELIIREAAK